MPWGFAALRLLRHTRTLRGGGTRIPNLLICRRIRRGHVVLPHDVLLDALTRLLLPRGGSLPHAGISALGVGSGPVVLFAMIYGVIAESTRSSCSIRRWIVKW